MNAGLSYTAPEDRWGAQLVSTYVAAKDDVSSASYFKAPTYTTVDAAAYVNVTPNLSVGVAVNNLFDRSYYNYVNVIGLSETSADRRRYLEAGRSFMLRTTLKL